MLVFLFKSMVCLSLLFGLYKLLLGQTTFFRANHATLIIITVLSVVIPFVEISVTRDIAGVGYVDEMMSAEYMQLLLLNAGNPTMESSGTGSLFSWQNALALIYIIGMAWCFFLIVRSAVRIVLFIRRTPAHSREADYTLLISDDASQAPCSFGRYVIMSRQDYEQNGEAILAHELCHVRHRHSVSVMLMNVLSAVLWLNPLVWLVREELLLVCEYEADMAVINLGIDAKRYQLLLIKKAVSPSRYTIANSLNHSSLKKRITMMRKSKSPRWAHVGYAGIALATALVVPAFAHKDFISPIESTLQENLAESLQSEIADKVTEISSPEQILAEEIAGKPVAEEAKGDTLEFVQPTVLSDGEVLTSADNMEKIPDFQGGFEALAQFIVENVKYPEAAVKAGKKGRVLVQFAVRKDGRVTDAEVIKGIDPELDAEALRAVNATSGKWIPGLQKGKPVNCLFTVPVGFGVE